MLQLFDQEGQKLRAATAEKYTIAKDVIKKTSKQTAALWEKINTPFSHTAPVIDPPSYQEEAEYKDVYLQLPVLSQKGK